MRGSGGLPISDGVLHVTSTENGEMLDRFNICGVLGGTSGEGDRVCSMEYCLKYYRYYTYEWKFLYYALIPDGNY